MSIFFTSAPAFGSLQSVSGRGAQPPVAIVGERLLDFLARVHHERTVLYHRLPQRLRCQQQEAYTFGCGLYAHVVAIGAKGCVTFTADPVRNFRDFLKLDERYSHCHWLFQHNGGVFLPPWGKAEQWLLSAQHTEQDAELFVGNFTRFVAALTS